MDGRYAAAALLLLVALAGCNAPADGTATETMSPAPVTGTPTATDAPARVAPGFTTDGVVDPEALASAHRETLDGSSYTVSVRQATVATNGSELGTNLDTARFGADGAYVRNRAATGAAPLYDRRYERVSVWSDGDTRFVLRVEDGERGYERQTAAPGAPIFPLPRQYLADALAGVEWTDVRAVPFGDDRDHYLLTGVRAETGGAVETVTVLLDERGLVYRLRTATTAERGSDVARRTTVVQYSAVGATTVDAPGWVATARNETAE